MYEDGGHRISVSAITWLYKEVVGEHVDSFELILNLDLIYAFDICRPVLVVGVIQDGAAQVVLSQRCLLPAGKAIT